MNNTATEWIEMRMAVFSFFSCLILVSLSSCSSDKKIVIESNGSIEIETPKGVITLTMEERDGLVTFTLENHLSIGRVRLEADNGTEIFANEMPHATNAGFLVGGRPIGTIQTSNSGKFEFAQLIVERDGKSFVIEIGGNGAINSTGNNGALNSSVFSED